MTDELREQLGRLDPMHPAVPVEPVTTPSSQARLEHIMNTPLVDRNTSDAMPDPSHEAVVALHTPTDLRRRRTWMVLGGAAAAAFVAIGGAVLINNAGGDDAPQIAAGPPLVLTLPASDPMAMCIQFDTTILAGMSPAFAGTVTAIDGDTVTLTVDRWYTGGDVATVELQGASATPGLEGGADFQVGQQYLVTATDGNVNSCGYTGLATPELAAAFDTAFPG